MTPTPGGEHPLDAQWPAFLDLLDSDPERARADFAEFAYRLIHAVMPASLAMLPSAYREDAIQDLLLHCICDDFRVLRTYKRQGRRFSNWLLRVLKNQVLDLGRREWAHPKDDVDDSLPAPSTPQSDPLLRKLLLEHLDAMGEKCRVLLKLLMDELKPREMAAVAARLLGYETYSNVQASNDLRYCRNNLGRALRAAGL